MKAKLETVIQQILLYSYLVYLRLDIYHPSTLNRNQRGGDYRSRQVSMWRVVGWLRRMTAPLYSPKPSQ